MSKEIITFGDIEIEKRKFSYRRNLILLKDVDVDNILISSMISSSKKNYKHFISYEDGDDYKFKPLCFMIPEMIAYVKSYEGKT